MKKPTPLTPAVKPAALIMPQLKPRTRSAADAWLERQNPLTRLSMRTAQQIYDTARNGNYARLQYIYAEIEKTDPTLLICVERRLSALGGLGWRVITTDDTPLAKAQKDRLQDLLENAENLSAAIEHLGLAFFRGHSFAAPYMKDGRLAFELPPSWEFNFDPFKRQWYHNPLVREGDVGGADQTPFDPDECLHLERVRAIDYPALAIFLRHDVAEDQWGRFLERYGIPPVILEMPPMTSAGDADRFAQAARNIYEALCGAVPNGTHINTLAEARGTDPFSAFIEHQEKTLVRLCTGGTLGSIAEAGSGTLAGNAQADVWREIVRRDAVLIGDEFTRYFARKLFPNDCRVKFELGTDRTATPDEMFDLGAKAKTAGYRLTKEYLETETGCTLEDDPSGGGFGSQNPLMNGESAPKPLVNSLTDKKNAQKGVANPLQNASSDLDEQVDPSNDTPSQIAKKRPSAQLSENALASALEELFEKSLAEAAAEELGNGEPGTGNGEEEPLKNSECRAQNPATCPTHGTPDKKDLPNEKPKIADASGAGTTTGSGTVDAPGASAHVPASPESVKSFLSNPPDRMSEAEVDSLLTTGFDDTDADGNKVKYGTLLRDHLDREAHSEADRIARKKRFGVAVKVVRTAKPQPSNNPQKPNERVYTGFHNGKAYIAVADEHNEIEAMEMVSYRRDSRKDFK